MILTNTVFTSCLKSFILTWYYMKGLIIWIDCHSDFGGVGYVHFSLQECIGNCAISLHAPCDSGW